jgi:hypothetical protein
LRSTMRCKPLEQGHIEEDIANELVEIGFAHRGARGRMWIAIAARLRWLGQRRGMSPPRSWPLSEPRTERRTGVSGYRWGIYLGVVGLAKAPKRRMPRPGGSRHSRTKLD